MKLILGTMTFGDQVVGAKAAEILTLFRDSGHIELDTAHLYHGGKTEALLGELASDESGFATATKVHPWNDAGLQPERIKQQFRESLSRLQANDVDLLYLHSPDIHTPISETLQACYELYCDGCFRRFGLSNFSAWQVAEVAELCRQNNWMQPTVYQGMYNALTRDVESELLPCLRNYNIAFYAYNPLAGGLLTGKHTDINRKPENGRFGRYGAYPDRYWKSDYFGVVSKFTDACGKHQIPPSEAALRWLCHHSVLVSNYSCYADHGIILGVSSKSHLEQNLKALAAGSLPRDIVDVLNQGWETTRTDCFKYFRT
ncbi:MAG: aldo/keto reductase [Gammaproteobacteria bacterium]|nr:aldo/keto reductase [Gammaproteobacteria bacterium]